MALLLRNARCAIVSPASLETMDLRIHQGTVVAAGKNLLPGRDDTLYDLKDKIVLPGFVNAHTHLYSSLARGMPRPGRQPANFLGILTDIWWKLDRALDDEAIYYSSLVGSLDAVRCGTTTLIDHHASPNAIKGSLDIVKTAIEETGLRGVLCYEVTDRGGKKKRDQGLAENERFIRANRKNQHFRGLVGAHASFTLSNQSLRLCGELAAAHKTGVHIHVAEGKCDVTDAEENYQCGVVDRLERHNVLKPQSILAHCIHLRSHDFPRVHEAGCWLVHNPRSNMNNRVGYAPVHLFGERGALGTDGFTADMFDEARIGFFKHRDSFMEGDVDIPKLLKGGQRMASEIFSKTFDALKAGSAADLVVLDYQPPTPFTKGNLASHVLFGMHSSMVESVMVGGKWVMKDREVLGVDVTKIHRKASEVAQRLWRRMEKM